VAGESSAAGRPHVADALVAAGHADHRAHAFDTWLSPGRPGHVERYAADLVDMIGLVDAAGGVSVVAHPWGRHDPTGFDEEVFAALAGVGLAGLEVDHQDHPPELRERLRGIARDLDLVVTGSSDYHGLGKSDHGLGVHTTSPDDYERLMDLAASASARSGRATPAVVG
jgi:predicted metal-dependent phosphoesterase TrpH